MAEADQYVQLVKEEEEAHKGGNIFKAVVLGVQFLFMFSAFNSAQNMVAQLYDQSGDKNLGIISLLVLYLVFGISTIFSPNICAKFNPKWVMLVSSLGYSFFLGSGLIVSYCKDFNDNHPESTGICQTSSIYSIVLVGASLCGLGAATLWVSQAWYISNICTVATRGLYYGIFWAFMQSSQITGNMLSFLLLGYSTQTYFITLFLLCLISGLSFSLLPSTHKVEDEIKGFKEKLQDMFRLLGNKRMTPMLFYYFFAGSIVAFYTGFLYKLVQQSLPDDTTDKEVSQKTAYVFIVLGCFEFLGGIVSGYLADRGNRYLITTGSTVIVEIALVISIICLYQQKYALCFVSAALWGLADCIVQNMCTVISSTLFPGQIEPFAISKLVQGIAITLIMLFQIFVSSQIVFILLIAFIEIITNVATSKLGVMKEQ